MEKGQEKLWPNMNELLSKVGSDFNVLEEEIDVNVQKEFMTMMEKLIKTPTKFKKICNKAQEYIEQLFDDSVSNEAKKQMLLALSTVDDVAVYRAIESYAKTDTDLKKWATVALQQSRMLIQSTLMDESTVYVSTGLGGHGSLLRYFCVYLAQKGVTLQPFQYDIAKKETELVITKAQGSLEQCDYFEKYITFTLLLPLKANLKEIFESIIDECNTYGHFLQDNMIITNIKKLSKEEIDKFIYKNA